MQKKHKLHLLAQYLISYPEVEQILKRVAIFTRSVHVLNNFVTCMISAKVKGESKVYYYEVTLSPNTRRYKVRSYSPEHFPLLSRNRKIMIIFLFVFGVGPCGDG